MKILDANCRYSLSSLKSHVMVYGSDMVEKSVQAYTEISWCTILRFED